MDKGRIRKIVDGWKNVLTGLGIKGRDKRMSADVAENFLDQSTCEALYQSDDVAARIVDRLPEEMLREGYEIKIIDADQKLAEKAMDSLNQLGFDEKCEEALKQARLYGGAGIIIGTGQNPEESLDQKNLGKLDYLVVLDRYKLEIGDQIDKDLKSANFGLPKFYRLSGTESIDEKTNIHHSRIIRFDGVKLPFNLRAKNSGWGDSVYSRLFNVIRNYNSAHDSAATIVQDFSQFIFKLKNLSDMLASGNDALVTKRLELVSLVSSICNAIVIEDGEECERKTTNVSGLPEMLKMIGNRLVSATDMPHTVLLGESPGASLGQGGQSETKDWYDHVKNQQESILRPALNRILNLIFSEKNGINGGKIPKYTIEFRSLWQMDLKEQAEIKKIMAEADAQYIDRNVLDAGEVAQSRFGGDGYSIETSLDEKLRKGLEKEGKIGSEVE